MAGKFELEKDLAGKIRLVVAGGEEEIVIEREKPGGEIAIQYCPGLTGVYDAGGDLNRVTFLLGKYLNNYDRREIKKMPKGFRDILSRLRNYGSDLRVQVNLKADWFILSHVTRRINEKICSSKFSEAEGRSIRAEMVGRWWTKKRRVLFQLQFDGTNLLLIRFGEGGDFAANAAVFSNIDSKCLSEPIDAERVRAMLDLI